MSTVWTEIENRKVFTKKQKQELYRDKSRMITNVVQALKNLINMPERRDLLKSIEISRLKPTGDHLTVLFLTVKGLEEKTICRGHGGDAIIMDEPVPGKTWYCKDYPKIRKIPQKDFREVVKRYQLTETRIKSAIEKIKN